MTQKNKELLSIYVMKLMLQNHCVTYREFGDLIGTTGEAVRTWITGFREPSMHSIIKLEKAGANRDIIFSLIGGGC